MSRWARAASHPARRRVTSPPCRVPGFLPRHATCMRRTCCKGVPPWASGEGGVAQSSSRRRFSGIRRRPMASRTTSVVRGWLPSGEEYVPAPPSPASSMPSRRWASRSTSARDAVGSTPRTWKGFCAMGIPGATDGMAGDSFSWFSDHAGTVALAARAGVGGQEAPQLHDDHAEALHVSAFAGVPTLVHQSACLDEVRGLVQA